MRSSTSKRATATFAAVAMVVSLATSPVLARGGGGGGGHGGGGGGHFGGGFGAGAMTLPGGGGFHEGGGFHPGGERYSNFRGDRRFYGGDYNACVVNPYTLPQSPSYDPYSWPYLC